MMSVVTRVGQTSQTRLEGSHDAESLGRVSKKGRSNLLRFFI